MCYDYDQYNKIQIISFVSSIYQLIAKLIVRYVCKIFFSNAVGQFSCKTS